MTENQGSFDGIKVDITPALLENLARDEGIGFATVEYALPAVNTGFKHVVAIYEGSMGCNREEAHILAEIAQAKMNALRVPPFDRKGNMAANATTYIFKKTPEGEWEYRLETWNPGIWKKEDKQSKPLKLENIAKNPRLI